MSLCGAQVIVILTVHLSPRSNKGPKYLMASHVPQIQIKRKTMGHSGSTGIQPVIQLDQNGELNFPDFSKELLAKALYKKDPAKAIELLPLVRSWDGSNGIRGGQRGDGRVRWKRCCVSGFFRQKSRITSINILLNRWA